MRHHGSRAALAAAAALLWVGCAHAQVYGNYGAPAYGVPSYGGTAYGQTYPNSYSGNVVAGAAANPLGSWNNAAVGGTNLNGFNPSAVQTNQYGVNTGYGNTGTNYVQGQQQQVLTSKATDDVMSVGRTGSFASGANGANGTGAGGSASAKADVRGERMEGAAHVVDGKTLLIGANLIVLNGADAPAADQTCTDARGMAWECGRRARDRLAQLVAGQHVVCVGIEQARSGTAARCKVGMTDLGRTMVEDGYAMSPKAVAPVYLTDQSQAENSRRGMWTGTFKDPWDVRAGK